MDMMNKMKGLLSGLIFLGTLGCSPVSDTFASPEGSEGLSLSKAAPVSKMMEEAPAAPAENQGNLVPKKIRTGSATLETPDLKQAELTLTTEVQNLGGFVESTQASQYSSEMVMRIPAASFDTFMNSLGNLGKVTNRYVRTDDVTLQYYDLETRLKNQRLLLDQYRDFLKNAQKMEEILDVMARISQLTSEIESTEGQYRYLSRQVDYSTLTVSLQLPALAGGRSWPDLSEGLEDFGFTAVEFLAGFLFLFLSLLLYAPFVLGLVFLLVWLFIGKPGLWKRLKGLKYEGKKP